MILPPLEHHGSVSAGSTPERPDILGSQSAPAAGGLGGGAPPWFAGGITNALKLRRLNGEPVALLRGRVNVPQQPPAVREAVSEPRSRGGGLNEENRQPSLPVFRRHRSSETAQSFDERFSQPVQGARRSKQAGSRESWLGAAAAPQPGAGSPSQRSPSVASSGLAAGSSRPSSSRSSRLTSSEGNEAEAWCRQGPSGAEPRQAHRSHRRCCTDPTDTFTSAAFQDDPQAIVDTPDTMLPVPMRRNSRGEGHVDAGGVEGCWSSPLSRVTFSQSVEAHSGDLGECFMGDGLVAPEEFGDTQTVHIEGSPMETKQREEMDLLKRQRRTSVQSLLKEHNNSLASRLKKQYVMLSDMVSLVRSHLDPAREGGNAMLELMTSLRFYAQELMQCDRCSLFLKVKKGAKHVLWTMFEDGQEISIPLHSGLVGAAVRQRSAVRVEDAHQDPRFNPSVDHFTGYRTRSVLCVPVFAGNREDEDSCSPCSMSRPRGPDELDDVGSLSPTWSSRHEDILGVIQVINKLSKAGESAADGGQEVANFDQEDENILRSLASMSAITIMVTKALESERRAKDRFAALNSMARMLLKQSTGDVKSLYRHIQKEAARLCQCEHAFIYMLDHTNSFLRVESAAGDKINLRLPPLWATQTESMRRGAATAAFVAAHCVRHGEVVCIEDVQTDEYWANCVECRRLGLEAVNSLVALPIEREGLDGSREIIGVLQAVNKRDSKGRPLTFDADDLELLEGLSVYTANALTTSMAFRATAASYRTVELGNVDSYEAYDRKKTIRLSTFSAMTVSREDSILRRPEITWDTEVLTQVDLLNWDFNAIGKSDAELSKLFPPTFQAFDLSPNFGISDATLSRFAEEVANRYLKNPFHSYAHAWTVLQACIHAVCELDELANDIFAKVDILALFVAAVCHDLGHPGTNNSFQQKICSPLALLYNDESILENHHAASCFELLSTIPDANILSGLSKDEFRVVRRFICSAILSTDMSRHDRDLARLRAHVGTPLTKASEEDRQLAVSSLLHGADLSNPARSPKLAEAWARLLAEEFRMQTEKEAEAGVEVSAFMLAGYRESSEIFFITTFVKPLWDTLACVMPPLKLYVGHVNSNLERYRELVQRKEQEATSTFVAETTLQASEDSMAFSKTEGVLPELVPTEQEDPTAVRSGKCQRQLFQRSHLGQSGVDKAQLQASRFRSAN